MAKYDFLEIDDELHKGLPELTKDEFAQLEKNIVQDGGPTDPIIVWGAIIVDGRNRWKICKNHGLEFKVECKNFADNDECRDWIINRSLGRRNLTPTQRTMLIGELYINRRKAAQLPVANCEGGQNVPEANNHPIAATIGAEHGINEKTVRRAAEFVESLAKLSTPVREAIESQEVKATHAQVKQLAEMPALDQKAAVNAVKKGQVKKLKDALPAPAKKKPSANKKKLKFDDEAMLKCFKDLTQGMDKRATVYAENKDTKVYHIAVMEGLRKSRDNYDSWRRATG